LFVVDFCEASFDCVAGLLLLYFAPQLLNGSWNYALSLVLLVHFSCEDLLLACHCVGLSRASLSVREHSGTVTLDGSIYELRDVASLVAPLLIIVGTQDVVELVALL